MQLRLSTLLAGIAVAAGIPAGVLGQTPTVPPGYGQGPPNVIVSDAPCVPPGPPPHVALVYPLPSARNVRRDVGRVVVVIDEAQVAATIQLVARYPGSNLRSAVATVDGDVFPTAEQPLRQTILSIPIPRLAPRTTYSVQVQGSENASAPPRCRKRFGADAGEFATR